MRWMIRIPFAVPLAAVACAAVADPLFEPDEPLVATLRGPITEAYRDADEASPEYLAATWSFVDGGQTRTFDVRIRTRGKSRREACTYPPLMLNFKTKDLEGSPFEGQNKLKLVGPCKRSRSYQQQLFLELLAYRALQIVTPHSFDTRTVRLTYIDTTRDDRSWEHVTFLIEDEDAMAARNGFEPLKVPKLSRLRLDPIASAIVELFQLMIGNTDYSTIRGPAGSSCCHNVKLMHRADEEDAVVPVPYDFDSSGLVDAPYALPPEVVPISDVRKRYFTGICKRDSDWEAAIARFREVEPQIMALFEQSPDLDRRTRSRNVKYMQEFFDILADPRRVEKEIIGRCRGPTPEEDA